MKRYTIAIAFAVLLSGCETGGIDSKKALAPIPSRTVALMSSKGMSQASPIVIRSYKMEGELEIWKLNSEGRYALLKTFPICRWSGQLGPKKKQGDRQAPEGFYSITPGQMNPNSSYHLSFDTGFPNAYDRAHGRTGSNLMVHGACSSAGCFAMTDQAISEIYAIGREAFRGGQRSFQFQSYPFRLTPKNLVKHRMDPNYNFWKNLKEGSDYFEVTGKEPAVGVCGGRYVFGPTIDGCNPAVNPAVAAKIQKDEQEITQLANNTPAIRLVYQDGGQHRSFRNRSERLQMSRPEAVAEGPREVIVGGDSTALAFSPIQNNDAQTAPTEPAKVASTKNMTPKKQPQSEEEPMYRKIMGGITTSVGGLFGSKS